MADEAKKRPRKLSKVVDGTVITITETVTGTILTYDATKLPAAIQTKLMVHGLSQKLGDSAAGTEGQEAVDNIKKVYEELVKGEWSTRAPAAEKISKKSILEKYNAMPEGKEKQLAKGLLENLGILTPAKK